MDQCRHYVSGFLAHRAEAEGALPSLQASLNARFRNAYFELASRAEEQSIVRLEEIARQIDQILSPRRPK